MNTVYAFCRKTDDLVDESEENEDIKYEKLRKWRIELDKAFCGESDYPLLNKLARIIRQFNIPMDPFFDLIRGMEMDLQKKRYLTFNDLLEYCYSVASTVGLMCIEIFGYRNKSTREYAINLGLALQLTNILRDIRQDAAMGRIYLPQEEMKKFDYSENDLIHNVYNEKFKNLMNYQVARTKSYFQNANRALTIEDKPSLFAARAMQHIYYGILEKIERENFNVFDRRINLSKFRKISISLGVWAKYSLVY